FKSYIPIIVGVPMPRVYLLLLLQRETQQRSSLCNCPAYIYDTAPGLQSLTVSQFLQPGFQQMSSEDAHIRWLVCVTLYFVIQFPQPAPGLFHVQNCAVLGDEWIHKLASVVRVGSDRKACRRGRVFVIS